VVAAAPYRSRPLLTRPSQVLVVEPPLAGVQLADFLAEALPGRRPATLRQLIGSGEVSVNGEVVLANRRLRAGDVVMLTAAVPVAARAAAPAADRLPGVRFESDSTLVIDKPAGLPTVPDRSGREPGVHGLLAALRPGQDLRIVHRLDRDTSGCLVLAKGLAAARHFDVQFREGLVQKTYVALVHGVPPAPEFVIDAWLGPDRRRPGKVVAAASEQPGFRSARTEVTRAQAFHRHALLTLRPGTGRTHQLRVHLQSIGHPIVGDSDYGGEPLLLSAIKPGYKLRKGVSERPLTPRLFLHAEQIRFHDLDGSAVQVESPLPEDLAVALRQLQSFDERRRPPCD
jgi:RluA family pseudouridine synthase